MPRSWPPLRKDVPLTALVLLSLLLPFDQAQAQRPPPDTSMAAVVGAVRAGGGALARDILTQSRGPESPEKIAALLDSLVVIALAYRPGDPLDDLQAARAAQSAIGLAWGRLSTVPLPGAFDALARIVHESEDAGMQAASLWAMTQTETPDPAVLALLSEIATSDRFLAVQAVMLLWQEMGPPGLAALRRFHATGAVTQPQARAQLLFIARRQGWDP